MAVPCPTCGSDSVCIKRATYRNGLIQVRMCLQDHVFQHDKSWTGRQKQKQKRSGG